MYTGFLELQLKNLVKHRKEHAKSEMEEKSEIKKEVSRIRGDRKDYQKIIMVG